MTPVLCYQVKPSDPNFLKPGYVLVTPRWLLGSFCHHGSFSFGSKSNPLTVSVKETPRGTTWGVSSSVCACTSGGGAWRQHIFKDFQHIFKDFQHNFKDFQRLCMSLIAFGCFHPVLLDNSAFGQRNMIIPQ